jgi:hypothetical protein
MMFSFWAGQGPHSSPVARKNPFTFPGAEVCVCLPFRIWQACEVSTVGITPEGSARGHSNGTSSWCY